MLLASWPGRGLWDEYAMLKTRLVREQDAKLNFEVMAWLIQNYGSPQPPTVPSPLHKKPGLENSSWKTPDTRSIGEWAEDNCRIIKIDCHMTNWPTDLIPARDSVDTANLAAKFRLEALAAGGNPYLNVGPSKLCYDPHDCVEPGYFAARIILQLADLRIREFQSDYALTPLAQRMVTLISVAYCRQGFTLANLPEEMSKFLTAKGSPTQIPNHIVLNTMCFATCLGLRIRRQSAEQIIATYGSRMPQAFRRKVKQACRQMDNYAENLVVLQMLADPKPVQIEQSVKQAYDRALRA